MLCKQDYWLSLDRYINWSSTAKSTNDFYTDWQCRQMYKDHIEHFVNRRNTYNGRLYKEDPTIFYWDLINEPRWCDLSRCSAFLSNSSCSMTGRGTRPPQICCSASRSNGCQWECVSAAWRAALTMVQQANARCSCCRYVSSAD